MYVHVACIRMYIKFISHYTLSGAHNEEGKEREAPTQLIENPEFTHAGRVTNNKRGVIIR